MTAMPKMCVVRTDIEKPSEPHMAIIRDVLFGCFKGVNHVDDKRWKRLWSWAIRKEAGEMFDLETAFHRYLPYHKRHMKIENEVFKAQERFTNFKEFRNWLKIGSGFVVWVPGAKGGIVPLPRSIAFTELKEQEFHEFHENMIAFMRGDHCAPFLWKHLGSKSYEMMDSILSEFNE